MILPLVAPEEEDYYYTTEQALEDCAAHPDRKYPNMHADLSAMSAYNALSRDLDVTKRFLEKHYRKLLFGTDRFVREEEPLIIDLIQKMELPAPMEEAIFAKNAEKMLDLERGSL